MTAFDGTRSTPVPYNKLSLTGTEAPETELGLVTDGPFEDFIKYPRVFTSECL